MRVSVNLSAAETKAIQQVAKRNHRTVAGEVTWAVLVHIAAAEVAPDGSDDEHPF